ncbi:Crp/Fnr family transcriptional regulator [Sphingobacterium sp. 1.A.4]|uniref:Crp/Fnr family transcriptional regulator n=1 Tax=Sphingobacterium sp. 1.A.4 TaxID=2044603 RepID=UPI000C0BF42F|nr:Crp/Fnr family transcriptional regulator [Sphingobacterium sp. 1.A.4]
MLKILEKHINAIVPMPAADFQELTTYVEVVSLNKKEYLQELDHYSNDQYFVLQGCLRMFTLNEKGVEMTTDFALENWWISDHKSLLQETKSLCAIQAVEKSVVLRMSKQNEVKICERFPVMYGYFSAVYRKAYAAAQYRNILFKLYSKEEIYLQFSRNFPDFMQRVPQYLIASYLGLTPEYVSEIRKKSIS